MTKNEFVAKYTTGRPTEADVVALMEGSKSEKEWNDNCDAVKRLGGYPPFWYPAIMMSGLAHRVRATWIAPAARNLLPEHENPHVKVIELLPPGPEEIAQYNKERDFMKTVLDLQSIVDGKK